MVPVLLPLLLPLLLFISIIRAHPCLSPLLQQQQQPCSPSPCLPSMPPPMPMSSPCLPCPPSLPPPQLPPMMSLPQQQNPCCAMPQYVRPQLPYPPPPPFSSNSYGGGGYGGYSTRPQSFLPQQTSFPVPAYQVGPMPAEYVRMPVPLPVPIPAREKYPQMTAEESKKSEEAVKDPFEKENMPPKLLLARDEPKYALPSSPSVIAPSPIVYPTRPTYQYQQYAQQPQDRLPYPYPYLPNPNPYPGAVACVQPRPMPMAMPQSVQDCCVGCAPRPCRAKKSTKALGSKTAMNGTTGTGASTSSSSASHSVEWEESSRPLEGAEELCNDGELRKLLEESSSLPMLEAKQAILERAEKQQRQEEEGGGDRRPRAVHVFCAPKDLEYAVRTDKFCAGDVSDGICFVFFTM